MEPEYAWQYIIITRASLMILVFMSFEPPGPLVDQFKCYSHELCTAPLLPYYSQIKDLSVYA